MSQRRRTPAKEGTLLSDRAQDVAIAIDKPESPKGWGLSIDWRKLLTALTKTAIDASLGAIVSAAKSAVDIPAAFGKTSPRELTADEQGWVLLHRALMSALAWTVRANRAELGRLGDSSPEMQAYLDGLLSRDEPFEITPEFFDRPAQSPVYQALTAQFIGWLTVLGVSPEAQDRLTRYLAEDLPLALDAEERTNREDYDKLTAFFAETMADEAARKARNWRRYRARLVEDVRRPLFNLDPHEAGAVSLQDVYVPLRAYYEEPKEEQKDGTARGIEPDKAKRRVVVWLAEHIHAWVEAKPPDDPIRVISGEPGCGKSSFARMFAADLARRGRRVIYFPLHRMADVERDVGAELTRFAGSKDELGHDPLSDLTDNDPLLVIFDGLDELSKSSEVAGETARTFVDHVGRRVAGINHGHLRLMALLAGRPVVTATSTLVYREPGQRVHVLRYVIHAEGQDYTFTENNQAADQRDEWWHRYGRATNRDIPGLPTEYRDRGRSIDEITEQPLLNYLLALLADKHSAEGVAAGRLDSACALYRAMFDYLYQRIHRPDQPPPPSARLSREEYSTLLEEIATAAWHTGDRAVTYPALEEHFTAVGLNQLLKEDFGEILTGMVAVLNSFFFQPGRGLGAVEFTHKSFREYLTARRLVRAVMYIHDGLVQSPKYYTEGQAMKEWFDLTGRTPLDRELLQFLRDEVAASANREMAAGWQATLVQLFNRTLVEGMPAMPSTQVSFRQAERQARNAEEALLAAVNACALVTTEISPIAWASPTAAGNLIHRLRGQQGSNKERSVVLTCLGRIQLSKQDLFGQDFLGADLSFADLSSADLSSANLVYANLSSVDLSYADLSYANLSEAKLSSAKLSSAKLSSAKLSSAKLVYANLSSVDLSYADLSYADLSFADLSFANLSYANLSFADLFEAKLSFANLSFADLSFAKNLSPENLYGTHLYGRNLSDAKEWR